MFQGAANEVKRQTSPETSTETLHLGFSLTGFWRLEVILMAHLNRRESGSSVVIILGWLCC